MLNLIQGVVLSVDHIVATLGHALVDAILGVSAATLVVLSVRAWYNKAAAE